MKFTQKLSSFFPALNVCIYYLLSSLGFCYIYFHRIYYNADFYEKNMGGIYYILTFEGLKPNQFRLLIPFLFKALKTLLPFLHDKTAYFAMTLFISFFTIVFFYNILNVYFSNRNINQWLAMILFYPMIWQYIILNQMFEFTDFANLFFIMAGYYLILKKRNMMLLLTFAIGGYNHDSIGFLIVMYLLFHIKDLFKRQTIFYAAAMVLIFIVEKRINELIFISNPGVSFRLNYMQNLEYFATLPVHIVIRNILLFFGGLYFFVLYFFFSGKWKNFKTEYLYINLTVIPYIIIIFCIHTLFEARNYITAIPFMIILFLMFFSTQKNSFLKPIDTIKSENAA